jgi:hypothetical protein
MTNAGKEKKKYVSMKNSNPAVLTVRHLEALKMLSF